MGGSRLSYFFFPLLLSATIALADNPSPNAGDRPTAVKPAGPPKAKLEVVTDELHGHKISDPYRWLENADSPESQEYVKAQLAYTRSLLDPLPGRDRIYSRLRQL